MNGSSGFGGHERETGQSPVGRILPDVTLSSPSFQGGVQRRAMVISCGRNSWRRGYTFRIANMKRRSTNPGPITKNAPSKASHSWPLRSREPESYKHEKRY